MKNDKYITIITTTDKKRVAELIATNLLENKLAACIQIDKIESRYIWGGQLTEAKEYRLLIKSKDKHYSEIEKSILTYHNYELPQILKLDITDGLPAYLEWISKETSRYKA